jgi:hypothetical protein
MVPSPIPIVSSALDAREDVVSSFVPSYFGKKKSASNAAQSNHEVDCYTHNCENRLFYPLNFPKPIKLGFILVKSK